MMRRALFLVLCLAIAGCASVPEVDSSVGSTEVEAKPEVLGRRGPLTAKQTKALFAKLGPGAEDTLQRHLAVEQAVAETPLVAGNRTRVLHDGASSFAAVFDAIRGAKHHVHLEYYTLEDIQSGGQSLGDLLVAKRQEGVAVDVIYDSFGSSETPRGFFDRLNQAGVKLLDFHPMNPLDGGGTAYSLNDRDHRKILVVDGATAITGGVNLSTSYQSYVPGMSAPKPGQPALPWRDTDIEIDGPAAASLQQLFLDQWTQQKGPPLDDADLFPNVPPLGKEVVRIIGSTPDNSVPHYYVTLLSAIRTADSRIWLTAAYFVPTHQEMEDLLDAARRGVDVEILIPDDSDSPLAINVQHSHYTDLLEAGVKIYETHGVVLHSKTIAIDGVWSVIGSSNFDHRSVLFNDEVDAVVVGSDTAQDLEHNFQDRIATARRIDLDAWQSRPISQRVKEFFSRAWETLL